MPNFVSFDDGLTYVAISQIKSFGIDDSGIGDPFTLVKMLNGEEYRTSRPIAEFAELVGSVNAWY
jgi:hypothetical protein